MALQWGLLAILQSSAPAAVPWKPKVGLFSLWEWPQAGTGLRLMRLVHHWRMVPEPQSVSIHWHDHVDVL